MKSISLLKRPSRADLCDAPCTKQAGAETEVVELLADWRVFIEVPRCSVKCKDGNTQAYQADIAAADVEILECSQAYHATVESKAQQDEIWDKVREQGQQEQRQAFGAATRSYTETDLVEISSATRKCCRPQITPTRNLHCRSHSRPCTPPIFHRH